MASLYQIQALPELFQLMDLLQDFLAHAGKLIILIGFLKGFSEKG
jgi:hypothetical protein